MIRWALVGAGIAAVALVVDAAVRRWRDTAAAAARFDGWPTTE